MPLLTCRGITKAFSDRYVLNGASIDIYDRDRVGLIGRNGSGKSTLIRIILGDVRADSGTLRSAMKKLEIGYLPQRVELSSGSRGPLITGAKGADERRMAQASGGERTRIALASLFSSNHHLLLLDEPTNHMDHEGVSWLLEQLEKDKGAVLLISHDRYFLDRAVNRLYELDDGRCREFKGAYTFYREQRAIEYKSQLRRYELVRREEARIEQEVDRLRSWSAKAHREAPKVSEVRMGAKEHHRAKAKKMDRQVKSRIKRLNRLKIEGIRRPKDPDSVSFELSKAESRGRRALMVSDLSLELGERTLFGGASFYVEKGMKVGLYGPNGCGKTTLIRIICGELQGYSGEVWLSPSLKAGYLEQNPEPSGLDETVESYMGLCDMSAERQGSVRSAMASMGIGSEHMSKRLCELSQGEFVLLRLSSMVAEGCNLLILDEPTNHLDLPNREQLERALLDYAGTVVVATHDRYMLEQVADGILVFDGVHVRLAMGAEDAFASERSKDSVQNGKEQEREAVSKERTMLLQMRMAELTSRMSTLSSEDPKYAEADLELKEMIRERREVDDRL